ncbi:hypothetical protein C7I55_18280 [Sphingomonas deserti]|uniref:Uncharacterized protein n=2 Tax=Allosphingosinicella deserti TaxID=2116704 RepID=A0A2P7QK99_9SPHN|nr:hypothetical protein C7I55_18280 [Sphingomonas deserti]
MSQFTHRLIARESARVELVLTSCTGAPWHLSVSRGVERFIGRYPRIDGLVAEGALLQFRTAVPQG